MSDEEKQRDRNNRLQPQWVLLIVSVFLTVIGLSFCFAPVQPPSACLESPIATAGSSAENVGVCPPK